LDAVIIFRETLERHDAHGRALLVAPRVFDLHGRRLVRADHQLVFLQRVVMKTVGVGSADVETHSEFRAFHVPAMLVAESLFHEICGACISSVTGTISTCDPSASRLLKFTCSVTFDPIATTAGAALKSIVTSV
jgi:hypothetical protein